MPALSSLVFPIALVRRQRDRANPVARTAGLSMLAHAIRISGALTMSISGTLVLLLITDQLLSLYKRE